MTDHIAVGRLWRHGAVAAAIATAVNLLVLALGRTTGGTFVVVFDIDDEVVDGLNRFAQEQNLDGCHFTALGALRDGVVPSRACPSTWRATPSASTW